MLFIDLLDIEDVHIYTQSEHFAGRTVSFVFDADVYNVHDADDISADVEGNYKFKVRESLT